MPQRREPTQERFVLEEQDGIARQLLQAADNRPFF
jgi:hypothetical protein